MYSLIDALLLAFGPFLALLLIGYGFGTVAQQRHLQSLDRREAALGPLLLTNIEAGPAAKGELVIGSTVVAYDFFRRIAVILRNLIGGRFRMHEMMMMRARREAILRMAETAQSRGVVAVHNVRLVTSNLGANSTSMGGCEVLAYGTAIWEVDHG